MARRESTTRGFKRTGSVLSSRIREGGEARGFAVMRLLTHWEEIAGPSVAAISRPVEVSYGRGGLGATLSLLTTGPQAPMLEMQKEKIRAQVNACYGYNAIARVRITQTAPTGFSDGQVSFEHHSTKDRDIVPSKEATAKAAAQMQDVKDAGLRNALTRITAQFNAKSNASDEAS